MTSPYELLARFNQDGTVAGVSVRTITNVNGRGYESDPAPLSGTSDPAFIEFASQFAAAATAERDSLVAQVADLEQQKTELAAQMQAEIDRLTALLPPPVDPDAVPEFVTAVQGRLALRRAGLLSTVEQAVTTANGETQIFWEYAAEWHYNNAVLIALAGTIGLTSEQVDEMFRTAKGL